MNYPVIFWDPDTRDPINIPSFIYIQLMLCYCGVCLNRRWWLLVLARWEEFEQHEESMGQLQQQKQQPQQFSEAEANNVVNSRPPLSTHQDSPPTPASVLGQRPALVQRRPPLLGSMQTSSVPLSSVQSKTSVSAGDKPCEPHWLKQITNRAHVAISSAFGQSVRRYDDLTPPGLRNPGQNICFLNAIIQAVAHTPCLPEAVLQLQKRNPVDQLVWHFGELLRQLAAPTSTSIPLVLDTRDFRMQAYYEFPDGLIQHPLQMPRQSQQDAAECLTWIIEWLHLRMNDMSSRGAAISSGVERRLFDVFSWC